MFVGAYPPAARLLLGGSPLLFAILARLHDKLLMDMACKRPGFPSPTYLIDYYYVALYSVTVHIYWLCLFSEMICDESPERFLPPSPAPS
jgi:hypothetical protein